MRVVVIGATGHIGGYLVPRLVDAGHDVVTLSRHARPYYREHASWTQVTNVTVDRDAEDAAGTFGPRVADFGADAVVDLICFEPDSARQLVEALRPKRTYLVHCGTIWIPAQAPWYRRPRMLRAGHSVSTGRPRRRSRSSCWKRVGAEACLWPCSTQVTSSDRGGCR